MLLMSATSCVERDILAVGTGSSSGVLDGLDHDAEHRESGALDVGRLGTDKRRDRLGGRKIGLRLLENRQDARFDELCGLYRVARCGGKGVLYEKLMHSCFSLSPR
jgi:hypothetical protein